MLPPCTCCNAELTHVCCMAPCRRKGRVVRGPVDNDVSALRIAAASNVFPDVLREDGAPLSDIVYEHPIDSADALRLLHCALPVYSGGTSVASASLQLCARHWACGSPGLLKMPCACHPVTAHVVAGKLCDSSAAEELMSGCIDDLPFLWEHYGEHCSAHDYTVDFGDSEFFEDEIGQAVRTDISTSLARTRVFGDTRNSSSCPSVRARSSLAWHARMHEQP